MKKTILSIVAAVAGLLSAEAAVINGTNYDVDNLTVRPITTSNGSPILSGGIVYIGYFKEDIAPLAANLNAENYAKIVDAFVAFGQPVKIGEHFEGLYDIAASGGTINDGTEIVGKSIYTFIGNGNSLADSTEIAIIKDDNAFAADAPLFTTWASLLEGGAQALVGNLNGPAVKVNDAFAEAPSLQLVNVGVIPEPMSAAFLLSSLTLVARRRRKA